VSYWILVVGAIVSIGEGERGVFNAPVRKAVGVYGGLHKIGKPRLTVDERLFPPYAERH